MQINLKNLILLPFFIAMGLIALFFFLMDDIVHLLIQRLIRIKTAIYNVFEGLGSYTITDRNDGGMDFYENSEEPNRNENS